APLVQDSHLVRVTGADEAAVRALAAAYADRFDTVRDAWETADLCHTANVGRSPLEFQTAVHGRDAAELAAALRDVAAGRVPIARADLDLTAERGAAQRGAAQRGAAEGGAAEGWAGEDHAAVADLVRAGYVHVDWPALSAPGARTTDLPTYPFTPETHWHTHGRSASTATASAAAPALTIRGATATPGQEGPEAFRVEWRERELPAGPPAAPGTVRLAVPEPALREALTAELRARGAVVAEPGQSADAVIAVGACSPGEPLDLSVFWTELAGLVRELPPHGGLLWAGCHGAAVHPGERAALRPEAAAMAMAAAAACAESRRPGAVVHLDPDEPAEVRAGRLAAEYAALRHGGEGTVAAYRRGVRYAQDLVAAAAGPRYEPSDDGYYLVTGGLGAIGRRLTERLIDRGARRVGVVGRSVIDAGRSAPLRELARRAEVAYLPCDVSDASALAAVAEELGTRWGRLRGVVHCSGAANPFGAMHRRPWGDAAKVIAPKASGSLNVVRLAKDRGADFVALVSSVAGARASAGRGLVDYSLANAYQLALAERENDIDTVVTAHAWPNWTGVGMEADASFAAAHSLDAGEAETAFFDHLLTGGAVIFPGRGPVPSTGAPAGAGHPTPAMAVLPAVVPTAAAGRDLAAMRASVRDAFVHVLGEDPGERPLQGLEIDSLVIAELVTALEQRAGLTVDPSSVMRARTADDLAAGLATTAGGAPSQPSPQAPADDRAAALSVLLRPLLQGGGER
ncbi:beta-ketoacyl reductase, partial [Nonomuraea pusilla]|uniref:beta-ketoacyl reductase n=1 Tax=Nonomuraea pusilla TaxID=46177 RepID=UPI00331CCB1D